MNITYADIMNKNLGYDPFELGYMKKNWRGTDADLLKLRKLPDIDKIWIFVRFQNKKFRVDFAVWCVNRALKNARIDAVISGKTYKAVIDSANSAYNAAYDATAAAYNAAATVAAAAAAVAVSAYVFDSANSSYTAFLSATTFSSDSEERKAQIKKLLRMHNKK